MRRNNNQYHKDTKNHKRILQTIICQQIRQPNEMDTFLEAYNLPRLNPEEIENLNRLITSNKIQSENSQQTEVLVQMASQVNSTKHLKKS